jgi:tRNA modification GTPase
MFSTDDTVVAIATPQGRAGIGVVRISGPDAERIARELTGRDRPLAPRHATLAKVRLQQDVARTPQHVARTGPHQHVVRTFRSAEPSGDQVVVTFFPQPHSYTGEDVIEISAHGSPVVLDAILRCAMDAGARLAEPGEFTLRAFLHGKLDLVQAEAVADLVDAVTPLQARAAFDQLEGTLTTSIGKIERELFELIAKLEASLDFPDEGYHFIEPAAVTNAVDTLAADISSLLQSAARGRLVREGAQVAIVGAPNVGKSSLFNALLNANRAIVTPVPGTTRDLLAERADIRGMSVALIDTAGIRDTVDIVEQEGVSRARQAVAVADLLLVVLDRSRSLSDEDRAILASTAGRQRVVVLNKIDLPPAEAMPIDGIAVSVVTGEGLARLTTVIAREIGARAEERDYPRVTNIRHIALLEHARGALTRARAAVSSSEEFLLADLQDAAAHLQEITGKRTTDDLLRHIFERFCIGK